MNNMLKLKPIGGSARVGGQLQDSQDREICIDTGDDREGLMMFGSRILIIGVDADMVAFLRGVIEKAGYEVDTAISAEKGLAQIEAIQPDLILCDITMPDKDGRWFEREFRRRYSHLSNTHTCLLEMKLARRSIMDAIRVGVDSYLEQLIEEGKKSAVATVLYVEDNPANLQLMEVIINRIGNVSLISAKNAETGISMAEQHQPDLILMDISLPGMDGIAARKILGANEKTRDIPIVAISAAAMKEDIDQAMNAGFSAYLTKPFHVAEVAELIKSSCGLSQ